MSDSMGAGDSGLVRPTEFLDHESEEMRTFVTEALSGVKDSTRAKVVRLYYAVRDGLFYEVYGTDLSRSGLRASSIVRSGQGFCLHKSIVFAAAVRSVGVPSRLVFADVRNHLASERLKRLVGGEVFFHALTSIYLNNTWLRATPVFNELLCRLYGISPLAFDGHEDSVHHPHEMGHMEFLRTHGEFNDLPYDFVINNMRRAHPDFIAQSATVGGSLVTEAPSR